MHHIRFAIASHILNRYWQSLSISIQKDFSLNFGLSNLSKNTSNLRQNILPPEPYSLDAHLLLEMLCSAPLLLVATAFSGVIFFLWVLFLLGFVTWVTNGSCQPGNTQCMGWYHNPMWLVRTGYAMSLKVTENAGKTNEGFAKKKKSQRNFLLSKGSESCCLNSNLFIWTG